MGNRYYTINEFLKNKHGNKFVKLSIDGGFTCPNRDGTLSFGGCLFCSEKGSGEFSGDHFLQNHQNQNTITSLEEGRTSIEIQLDHQCDLMKNKWQSNHYIAYFQNFTNTYDHPNRLKEKYDRALAYKGVEGLAISTRADCLDDSIIKILRSYTSLDVFWLELGLQTICETTRKYLNLHQSLEDFYATCEKLNQADIPFVLHVIAGLPGESLEDFLSTIDRVNRLKPFGIKIHMLNILKNTGLERDYQKNPYELLDRESYIDWVGQAIRRLSPQITIHRLTGDGPKDLLVEPRWILDKRRVLNGIEKHLKEKNIFQGMDYVTLKDE